MALPTVQIDSNYYADLATQIQNFATRFKPPADLHPASGYSPSAFPESAPLGAAVTGASEAVINWNNGVAETLNYVSSFLRGVAQIFPDLDHQKAAEIDASLKKIQDGITQQPAAN